MTLSLVGIPREAQLQILKKLWLVLAGFHDTFISRILFIYLFMSWQLFLMRYIWTLGRGSRNR